MSNEPIQLSAEETKEIQGMMKENAKKAKMGGVRKKSKKAAPQKSKKKKSNVEADIESAYRQMKKILKVRTKSDLIEIIWTYGVQLREMQHALQVLLEENKELKGNEAVQESENEEK